MSLSLISVHFSPAQHVVGLLLELLQQHSNQTLADPPDGASKLETSSPARRRGAKEKEKQHLTTSENNKEQTSDQ
jgi:hypothetical protein